MASLKHDAQGFLVGTPIDFGDAAKTWGEIRNDVRAIRQALVGSAPYRPGAPKVRQQAANESTVRGRTAPATPGGSGQRAAGTVSPSRVVAEQKAVAVVARKAVEAALPKRGTNGRFVAGGGKNGEGAGGEGDRGKDDGRHSSASFIGRLSRAVLNAGGGLEEADPTVKAFQEVAQPLARGYELFSGGSEDKKQTGLLRRIFGSLNVFRKEETTFNKAANRSLKNLEEKPEGGSGSGAGGGLLMALLRLVPGFGLLTAALGKASGMVTSFGALLAKIPGVGKVLGLGKGMLSKIPGLGGLFGGGAKALGKGMLKRVPILGALLGGAFAWNDANAAENDASLTGDQRNGQKGKAWGGAAGGVIGAMIGSFLGPVGTIAGAVIGDWLGGQFGEMIGGKWVAMTEGISGAWTTCTDFFTETWKGVTKRWEGFVDSAKSGWETIAGTFRAAYEGLKKLPVIGPAIEAAESATKKAVEVGAQAVQSVKSLAATAGNAAVEATKKGVEYVAKNTLVGRGLKSAGSWVLGQTSRLFESGKGGAGTISAGKGDHGGASYGTYQLSSKMGEVQKFLDQSGYGRQFAGLDVGSAAFNAKWAEVAKSDPAFATAEHDYIKGSKFDPQMTKLQKAGIDLSGRGAAVQDSVWSTSVQFGGNTDLIRKALTGKDVSAMSDAEVVSAIQDYKIANNDRLFRSSAEGVRASTAKRAEVEKARLIALAGQAGSIAAPTMPAVTASARAPSVPASISMPPVSDAPPVVDPMASTGGKAVVVTASTPDVGQDLRDRRIAHVVTGAMSA